MLCPDCPRQAVLPAKVLKHACHRQQLPARSGSGQSSDLRAAWGAPAEGAAAPAAASGLGKVGLGSQAGAEPSRLLSDGCAAFEGGRGLGLCSRRLPLGLDRQEGGQVEVQHGHPPTGRGYALAALRAGDPALLMGRHVQLAYTRLAEGVATVEAAWQVSGKVIGRVADDAVTPPGPSSCPSSEAWDPSGCSILGEACSGAQAHPAHLCSCSLLLGPQNWKPTWRTGTQASAELGEWVVASGL